MNFQEWKWLLQLTDLITWKYDIDHPGYHGRLIFKDRHRLQRFEVVDERRTAGTLKRLGIREDLADARTHSGVVTRDEVFHIRRRRHFRGRSFQGGARLREIDDGRVLEDDTDEGAEAMNARARAALERIGDER